MAIYHFEGWTKSVRKLSWDSAFKGYVYKDGTS